ncbi:MAG TPA: hypothetical protein VFV43_12490 [Limnobacter sp.]|nr:hypothetical protein [Limnobacter sp.]
MLNPSSSEVSGGTAYVRIDNLSLLSFATNGSDAAGYAVDPDVELATSDKTPVLSVKGLALVATSTSDLSAVAADPLAYLQDRQPSVVLSDEGDLALEASWDLGPVGKFDSLSIQPRLQDLGNVLSIVSLNLARATQARLGDDSAPPVVGVQVAPGSVGEAALPMVGTFNGAAPPVLAADAAITMFTNGLDAGVAQLSTSPARPVLLAFSTGAQSTDQAIRQHLPSDGEQTATGDLGRLAVQLVNAPVEAINAFDQAVGKPLAGAIGEQGLPTLPAEALAGIAVLPSGGLADGAALAKQRVFQSASKVDRNLAEITIKSFNAGFLIAGSTLGVLANASMLSKMAYNTVESGDINIMSTITRITSEREQAFANYAPIAENLVAFSANFGSVDGGNPTPGKYLDPASYMPEDGGEDPGGETPPPTPEQTIAAALTAPPTEEGYLNGVQEAVEANVFPLTNDAIGNVALDALPTFIQEAQVGEGATDFGGNVDAPADTDYVEDNSGALDTADRVLSEPANGARFLGGMFGGDGGNEGGSTVLGPLNENVDDPLASGIIGGVDQLFTGVGTALNEVADGYDAMSAAVYSDGEAFPPENPQTYEPALAGAAISTLEGAGGALAGAGMGFVGFLTSLNPAA